MTSARSYPIQREWSGRVSLPTLRSVAGLATLFAFLVLVGEAAQKPSELRVAIAAAVAVLLVGVATRSPAGALPVVFTWLVALGMIRRLVSELAPSTTTDALLLVSPLLLVVLTGAAARRGAFRERTTLTNGVLVLSILSLFAAVNPLQGSLLGGFAGLLFVLVPMLAFWIGRAFCDDRVLALLLRLVAGLGVVVAVYGFIQLWVGFPGWDKQWMNEVQSSYVALNVNGVIRPFAAFSSASEYGTFLAVAIVVWLAIGLRINLLPLTVVALALLVPALVLESARGAVVALMVALGVLVGAHRRLPIAISLGVAALLLIALVVGLRHYGTTSSGGKGASALIQHQVVGLSDPLNPQNSTAATHLSELRNGLEHAFTQPLGEGIGAVTIAGGKFGGIQKGTELDPSNVAVGLGLPGLCAYLVVLVAGILRLYRIAVRRHDALAFAALGVATVTLGQWLNGGQYAAALVPWLVLGWADRPEHQSNVQPDSVGSLES